MKLELLEMHFVIFSNKIVIFSAFAKPKPLVYNSFNLYRLRYNSRDFSPRELKTKQVSRLKTSVTYSEIIEFEAGDTEANW